MKFTLKLASNEDYVATRPLVMAILNATPDSFSDGGELDTQESLDNRIKQVIDEGADIIDIGGESTRPGFSSVDETEEIARVVPVIKAVRDISSTIPISIDTQKAAVAQAALQAGADLINDISALSDPDMAELVKKHQCTIVLMRNKPLSEDLVASCKKQFEEIIKNTNEQGIAAQQIILDPGLGFGDLASKDFTKLPGSNPHANLELINSISDYSIDLPVLIGGSRKRFIGEITGEKDAKKRVSGSVTIALLAAQKGASILRVHDVRETVQALKTLPNPEQAYLHFLRH